MSRLLVHVEGQTEETFVNELLCPHLTRFGWSMVSARLLGHARRRDRRGGIKSWGSARTEIVSGWDAWSADTRSPCSARLPHWRSGSERCGANARTSETGWIDSNSCRIPARDRVHAGRIDFLAHLGAAVRQQMRLDHGFERLFAGAFHGWYQSTRIGPG
jgi:hypothetical protein